MATREVSGWTVGFAVFAGVMLMLVGIFHALTGLAAIIENEYFVVGRELRLRARRDRAGAGCI